MRQTTLNLGKRPAQTTLAGSSKRIAASNGSGTSATTPIVLDLDNGDDREDKEPSHEVASKKLDSLISKADSSDSPHEGPSQMSPTHINPATFSIPSLFSHSAGRPMTKDPDLDLLFYHPFLLPMPSQQLYRYLLRELPWYRVVYEIRGTTIRTPRWTCVWGCDDTGAIDSVYDIKPRAIPDVLQELKAHVEEQTGAKYNFVLVNFYESGKDSISWHSDDESFLGPNPTIASLSLGSPRDFQMKHKRASGAEVEKWKLLSGDMIVMRGPTQANWLHSVPKRANAGGRINITFRRAMNTAGTNNYYRYNVFTGPVHRWKNGTMTIAPKE